MALFGSRNKTDEQSSGEGTRSRRDESSEKVVTQSTVGSSAQGDTAAILCWTEEIERRSITSRIADLLPFRGHIESQFSEPLGLFPEKTTEDAHRHYGNQTPGE